MGFKLLYTNLAGPLGDINTSAALVAESGMVGYIAANSSTGDPEVQLADDSTTGALGIIDDNKTTSFSATVINEVVASGQSTLAHANIICKQNGSHLSTSAGSIEVADKTLGTVTVTGLAPSETANVSYAYAIPGKAGDDTTLASGKCTIWLAEGEYSTDVYELHTGSASAENYTVGAKLRVADNDHGQAGRLTVRTSVSGVIVGYVTKAPTAGNPFMNFFFKPVVS